MIKWRFLSRYNIYFLILISILLAFFIYYIIPGDSERLEKLLDSISDTTSFKQSPNYVGILEVGNLKKSIRPGTITFWNDLLFVSYINSTIIDVFDDRFKIVNSYNFSKGERVSITGISVDSNFIYIADFLNEEIRIYNHLGQTKIIFKWYPDNILNIGCYDLFSKDGMLYVSDNKHANILAISTTDEPGLNNVGELIFIITEYNGEQKQLSSPSAITVTNDGRILVGDNKMGGINVFTCDGRFIYAFGNNGEGKTFAPNDFAFDQLQSPELLKKQKFQFETSKISEQGRIHVLDSKIARIKVYNELGEYVLTYGKELNQPVGIAIDQKRRLIFISDSNPCAIVIYKY